MPIIDVENVGKKYHIKCQKDEPYKTLAGALTNIPKQLFGKKSRLYHEDFWALNDVSFQVNQGDKIGIIGRNGAGKSTLLKILTRITQPTIGRISIQGRVASLLEVGTGFHPELTGRENIFLNGAILGMSKKEIKSKFDEIVAFAEIEKFLDTPVKRYSSGMYVRLAFAVAAHLEPEILLVDEVLAVGDIEFQKKCLGKMGAIAKEGRTILFVSHNIGAVANLCSRGMVLEKGKLVKTGTTEDAIAFYTNSLYSSGNKMYHRDLITDDTNVVFNDIKLIGIDNHIVTQFNASTSIGVSISYIVKKPVEGLYLSLQVRTATGQPIFTTSSADMNVYMHPDNPSGALKRLKYGGIAKVTIPASLLNIGMYEVLVSAFEYKKPSRGIIDLVGGIFFEIIDDGKWITVPFNCQRQGVIVRQIPWEVE